MGKPRLTKDVVNQRVAHRGIKLVGEYISTSTKTMFECKNGHTWLAKPNNVMGTRQSGCPHCDGQFPLTKDAVNFRIQHKLISMTSEYTGVDQLSTFLCHTCNSTFQSTPYLMMTKSFCHHCHQRRGGFNRYKPGTFYILDLVELDCLKFGITNNLSQRIRKHTSSSRCNLIFSKNYTNGNDAFLVEKLVKQFVGPYTLTKELLQDGYTETCDRSKLQDVIQLVTTSCN